MRTFHLITGGALLAGLCWAPLLRAEDAPRDSHPPTHATDQDQHPHFCDTDKDRDELRERLKHMDAKQRHESLARLRHDMEERRQRLDHLCDVVRHNSNLSDDRKKDLLETIEKLRREIRGRMDEFLGDDKAREEERKDHFEFAKVGDRISDLKDFIPNHPSLTDREKKVLLDKMADLHDPRHDNRDDARHGRDGDAGTATQSWGAARTFNCSADSAVNLLVLNGDQDHTPGTTPPAPSDHADGDEPHVRFCDSDKDRDHLRDQLKHMDEKHRHEFLTRLRHALEERRQRLDHLCDIIRNNPNLSDKRKHEILETIEKLRKQIRERMAEFQGDDKQREDEHKDHFELAKVGDHISDLRHFIEHHPCLTDGEKKALLDKLSDLKDERQSDRQDLKNDTQGDAGNAADHAVGGGSGSTPCTSTSGNNGAISNADMLALQQKMAAISAQHQAEEKADHQDIHQDVQTIQTGKQTLATDKSAGDSAAAKQDAKTLHQDQKDLHKDIRDAHADDHPLLAHDGAKNGAKDGDKDARPFLNDEQRAKLRERLETFLKNHADGTHDAHPEITDTQRAHLRDLLQGIRDHRDLEFHGKVDFAHDRMDHIVDSIDLHRDGKEADHHDPRADHR
ncbi:MAG: hypothetical protein ACREJ2_12670 [Planctomycetota bacterium]